jgi:hypothetical protein
MVKISHVTTDLKAREQRVKEGGQSDRAIERTREEHREEDLYMYNMYNMNIYRGPIYIRIILIYMLFIQ